MKTLKIEIPDGEYDEFCDFMCEQHQYQDEVFNKDSADPVPNPESKEDFAIRHLEENVFINFVNWKKMRFIETQDIKTEIKVKK